MKKDKKVMEYPSELVKWVLHMVSTIIESQGEARDIIYACSLAVAIMASPDKFSISDYVSFVFDSAFGDLKSSVGYAGQQFRVRVSIKSTGVRIYWDNEFFDTFAEPSVHEYDKGHWQFTSECDGSCNFEYYRDNHFYCCDTLCKVVAVSKGKRRSWSLSQASS